MPEIQDQIQKNIEQHGWHAQCVFGDEAWPEFTYSIGWGITRQWPEVIVVGQRSDVAHGMMMRIWEPGVAPKADTVRRDILDGYSCHLKVVDLSWYEFLFGAAIDQYVNNNHPPFRALQCVWPTTCAVLPWDPGAPDWFDKAQPVVTEKMAQEPV